MAIPAGFISILPLRNTVVFPGVHQVLRVGRAKSIKAVQRAQDLDGWIICVTQKNGDLADVESLQGIYATGVLCKIESVKGNEEQGLQIVVRGYQKININSLNEKTEFLEGLGDVINDVIDIDDQLKKALILSLKEISLEVLSLVPADTSQLQKLVEGIEDLSYLGFLAASHLDVALTEKQHILENPSLKERTMSLLTLLQKLKEQLQVQSEIRSRLSSKFGKFQREQILREQLKVIKEELGEGSEDSEDDLSKIEERVNSLEMPDEARKLARQQLKHLRQINPNSPEYQVTRNHLDFLLSLPWVTVTEENDIDLRKVQEILDHDHYGLEKIKKRIIQHLAVLKMRKTHQGSLLLLVGPPGVGKTSLGQSIARALGKKYVRASLGGLRDDAEIRGHRRTYVGAMAGRILTGIKRAEVKNPVFVLDEIDKMTHSWAGDPASTLLEVLDPEQNAHFQDHYLDTGFDLSKVFFIATANSLDGIPRPLLDRMEVIELSGYTLAEKVHIAKKHLLPKQMKEHGIVDGALQITDAALNKIITTYTREAGVRDLQRRIATLCRACCEKVVNLESGSLARVDLADLEDLLGAERYSADVTDAVSVPGVVTGMAWTPVGGDILFIESAQMSGSGQLLITGQLGEVMKESALIAYSLIKSQLTLVNPGFDFSKQDIHIHVPAGAIPKDGPSAGVTMVTAMASLLLRTPVNPKLAMTGEITLRGAVMPVGGIKEKVLAAHRAGVKIILLPRLNEKDLKEVPEEIRKQLTVHLVDNVGEVLKLALGFEQLPNPIKGELPNPVVAPWSTL